MVVTDSAGSTTRAVLFRFRWSPKGGSRGFLSVLGTLAQGRVSMDPYACLHPCAGGVFPVAV